MIAVEALDLIDTIISSPESGEALAREIMNGKGIDEAADRMPKTNLPR